MKTSQGIHKQIDKNNTESSLCKGQLPLYLQLERILEGEIISGKYSEGRLLPTEGELCKMYNVSRITVRRAVSNLKNKGIIDSQQGKGTFIAVPNFLPGGKLHLFQSIEGLLYFPPRTENKVIHQGYISTPKKLAPLDSFSDNPKTYCIEGLRILDKEILGHFNAYILPEFGPLFTEETPLGALLVLEQKGGVRIQETHQTIGAVKCNKNLARLLKSEAGEPLIVFERRYFSAEKRLVQVTITHFRGDRYEYTIKMERRET